MIYRDTESELKWIYAEDLLSVMFQYAKKKGIDQVTAVFPGEYGRELVCGKENDIAFFAGHGFVPLKKGVMSATAADYERMTAYKGPSLKEEGLALYELFGDITPEEYGSLAEMEDPKEPERSPEVNRESSELKEMKLRDLAELLALRNAALRHLILDKEEGTSCGDDEVLP
ncbi:MAG: hypothetical protein IJT16_06430 [Lachnospiraceae bacterium]|nr:hypothetical protein [Lachnospiraceae bacterium]